MRADDLTEWLSNGRNFECGGMIYFSIDDML
jgi:hypothetical protein